MISWTLSAADRQNDELDGPIVVRVPARYDGIGNALRRAFEAEPAPADCELKALLARLG